MGEDGKKLVRGTGGYGSQSVRGWMGMDVKGAGTSGIGMKFRPRADLYT